MNDNNLYKIAVTLSKPPKGILAADESTNTLQKDLIVSALILHLKTEENIENYSLKPMI